MLAHSLSPVCIGFMLHHPLHPAALPLWTSLTEYHLVVLVGSIAQVTQTLKTFMLFVFVFLFYDYQMSRYIILEKKLIFAKKKIIIQFSQYRLFTK